MATASATTPLLAAAAAARPTPPLPAASRPSTLTELRVLATYTAPIATTLVLQIAYNVAPTIFLGRLGTLELAAVSLANAFITLAGVSILNGAATALDTLCAQAYTATATSLPGHEKPPGAVGLHLQRGLLLSAILLVPISLVFWHAHAIFLALGQDDALARPAAAVVRVAMLGVPASIAFECVKRFLQGQGIMRASTIVVAIMAPVGVAAAYLLIATPYGLGMLGAPLALAITYWGKLALICLYTAYVQGGDHWQGWSRQVFSHWRPHLQLALPGIVVVCASLWVVDLLNLAASYYGAAALAAQTVAFQCTFFGFVVFLALSTAVSARIGHLLGAQQPQHARRAALVALAAAAIMALTNAYLLIALRSSLPLLFVKDPLVVVLVELLIPIIAYTLFFAALTQTCAGILNGVGRQKTAALVKVACIYGGGVPLAYYLAVVGEMQLFGLWLAFLAAMAAVAISLLVVILRIDWEREVVRCQQRVGGVAAAAAVASEAVQP